MEHKNAFSFSSGVDLLFQTPPSFWIRSNSSNSFNFSLLSPALSKTSIFALATEILNIYRSHLQIVPNNTVFVPYGNYIFLYQESAID